MFKQPLVSVLMPLYNKVAYVAETIESVLNQTYPNIELIIVDDGSTDGSLIIANGYVSERVVVIKQENKGGSAARNTAFLHSKGDFIQYLDADDILDARKIEKQVEILRGQTDVLTIAKGKDFIVQKNGDWQVLERPLLSKNYADMNCFLLDEVKQAALVHSWLIPRNWVEKAGKWDETMTIFEDRDFYLRLVPLASRIVFCPDSICYWRLPTSSAHLSQRINQIDFEGALDYFLRFERLLVPKNKEARVVLACLFKKLLVKAYTQKPIVAEIRARCLRLGLVPDCSRNLVIRLLPRLFGVRIAFQILLLKIIFDRQFSMKGWIKK